MSLLRIYGKDGKPQKMEHYLPFASQGPKDGELAFVSGNPGGTSRTVTVSQLVYARDVQLPQTLYRLSELRGLLNEYQHRGAEQRRHSQGLLFGIENGIKALKGRQEALADAEFFGSLKQTEADFRAKVNAKPDLKAKYASAWTEVDKAVAIARAQRVEYGALERGPMAQTFGYARMLLRWADESQKPNAERLREYTDSRLPSLKMRLGAPTPVYDELDETTLAWSLTKMREDLSPDSPIIKKLLGDKSPEEVAKALVKGTKLKNPKVRMKLFEGGKKAVDAAKDPMIEFARLFDPEARAVRKRFEDQVDGPAEKAAEQIAAARFAIYGTSIYPDATFTLRLSYGQVKGWMEGTHEVKPFTTMEGAFERATGKDPFALPKSWLASKAKLDLATPFNLVTTNDIIGGNSGSPMINQKGELIGLVFDGNIHSLGGDYGFDEKLNRTVAVHHAAITEALSKIYGGKRLVDELTGASKGVTTTGAK